MPLVLTKIHAHVKSSLCNSTVDIRLMCYAHKSDFYMHKPWGFMKIFAKVSSFLFFVCGL